MSLTREVMNRRLLIGECALIAVGSLCLGLAQRSILFGSIAAIFLILLGTLIWINTLVRHDLTNFEVCMVIGVFVFAADSWLYGYKVAGGLIGLAGVVGGIWLLTKLLRPLSNLQQEANLERYREQWRADKLGRSLVGELGGLIIPMIVWCIVWAKSGFSKAVLWTFLAIFAWLAARIVLLRRFPSGADKIGAIPAGNNH